MNENVNWYNFLREIEAVALDYDFRVYLERAPIGCGFFFRFKDEHTGKRSKPFSFNLNHPSNPGLIFVILREEAQKFKQELIR